LPYPLCVISIDILLRFFKETIFSSFQPWPGNTSFLLPCPALEYLEKVYLGSRGVIDALTWHHYYMDGKSATINDFVNPKLVFLYEHKIS
jgi:hypothetical protein